MPDFSLPSGTHVGFVHLRVSDRERARAFYAELLGFKAVQSQQTPEQDTLLLSATGEEPIHLLLTEKPGARPKPPQTCGLFHVAIRLPDRQALARVFKRLLAHNWAFQGFSDHGVSEALYLADPDGLGLELYRDRPREEWPRQNGQIEMRTNPLDLQDLLAEVDNDSVPWDGIHPGTDIGHVHLQVSELAEAENFYHILLGLEVTQRSYPGALFFSAGGYHHHVGTNIWSSRGAPPAPQDAVGLISFSLEIPDREAWATLVSRIRQTSGEITIEKFGTSLSASLSDPFGNGVELTAR
ncbi:MAG TPA: VOC family protein [Anaerolineales bacterium]